MDFDDNPKNIVLVFVGIVLALVALIFGSSINLSEYFGEEKEETKFTEVKKVDVSLKKNESNGNFVTINLTKNEEQKLYTFWNKQDKTREPKDSEIVNKVINEFFVKIGEDEFYFNYGITYVAYENKSVRLDKEFYDYLNSLVYEYHS